VIRTVRSIGSSGSHSGTKVKFGHQWHWIHWIKPDGAVIVVATKGEAVSK
jgi:hypothetical protein